MESCNQALEKVTYSPELEKEYEPLIKLMVGQICYNYNHSTFAYDIDDMMQIGKIHLWEATKKYDPSRKAKFRNFFIMMLRSKLISLGTKQEKQLESLKIQNEDYVKNHYINSETIGSDNEDYLWIKSNPNNYSRHPVDEIFDTKKLLSDFDHIIKGMKKEIKKRINESFKNIGNQKCRKDLIEYYKRNSKKIKKAEFKKTIFIRHFLMGERASEIQRLDDSYSKFHVIKNIKEVESILKTLVLN